MSREFESRPATQTADPEIMTRPVRDTTGSHGGGLVSAFSVDVEDYFHDESFRAWIPKDRWESLDQRVEASTRRLIDILDDSGVKATFFVLGWVAERNASLVLDIYQH